MSPPAPTSNPSRGAEGGLSQSLTVPGDTVFLPLLCLWGHMETGAAWLLGVTRLPSATAPAAEGRACHPCRGLHRSRAGGDVLMT